MKGELCHKKDTHDMVRRYEYTLKRVAGYFYPQGGHQYNTLLCDLTTHLWDVLCKKPDDIQGQEEQAWVNAVLYNKARNLVRNAQLHYSHIEYREDLPELADESTENPLVTRLYELVERLDVEDKQLVMMYLDHTPFKEMSRILGKSEPTLLRRMKKIERLLAQMNQQMD